MNEDVQAWLRENWFRAGILTGILMAAGSVVHYYTVFLPGEAAAKRTTAAVNHTMLDICLESSDKSYSSEWDAACKTVNLPDNCTLPGPKADTVNGYRREARAECFKRYGP
jgi:hypothetical protein